MENSDKSPITNEQRLALAAKLDKELDDFIDSLEKRPYTEGWPEDRWQEEMEKHPFFMKKLPEAGEELNPLMEGLQQLKYDPNENTPEELANAYKEDGNFNFKHKNYRLAIIAYTEGLKIKCGNPNIDATLLNNRSAANYFLKNYRSALIDSEWALKYKPDYDKALIRAAYCCFEIKQYEKAIHYCDIILKKNFDTQTTELRCKCVRGRKELERNARKQKKVDEEKTTKEVALLGRILNSGINLDSAKLENLKPQVPELADHMVHLNEDKLVWPVIFTYPEYRVMDFIQEFQDDDCFYMHLERIFEVAADWDIDKKYVVKDVQVYFEGRDNQIYPVHADQTLGAVLMNRGYVLKAGTPSFIIFVRNSVAESSFLKHRS
ncbi:hypothetical protein RN001_010943 [Aquatica leii]|uniref:Cns1/TTC4 wheel domain-containing protein n=1 Tax=Aquatica leii TaxID=1421715 RepID=A0AAN7PWZ8_9COLE|nr:hypothetical protein RN001_010943 [Aquatica leii]